MCHVLDRMGEDCGLIDLFGMMQKLGIIPTGLFLTVGGFDT